MNLCSRTLTLADLMDFQVVQTILNKIITGRFTSDMYARSIVAVLILSNRLSVIYGDRYEFALSPHFV